MISLISLSGRCGWKVMYEQVSRSYPNIYRWAPRDSLALKAYTCTVQSSDFGDEEKRRLGCLPYWSLFPLNVMCLTDRQFLFSHILLSLPLIPTLSTSADGKDSKTQGHSKIPGSLWCVQICHIDFKKKRNERRRKMAQCKKM